MVPAWAKAITDKHVGDPLALAGVVLAIGGFGTTVWQLIKTADASTAAIRAVEDLRFRVRSLEDLQLCSDCLNLALEIERYHVLVISKPTLQVFAFLPERYRTLRLNLTELRARRGDHLSAEEQAVVQASVAKLADGEKAAVRFISNAATRSQPNVAPLQSAMQALSTFLTVLSVNLTQTATGDDDDK